MTGVSSFKAIRDIIFVKRKEIVTRDVAGETFIVPVRGKLVDMKNIFAVEGLAGYIWRLIDGQITAGTICDEVLYEYEVGREEAQSDISEFFAELLDAGLVEKKVS